MQELRPSDAMIAILQSTQDALECDQSDRSAELRLGTLAVSLLSLPECSHIRIGYVASTISQFRVKDAVSE